jgi:CSLREA domain-containing protein
MLGRFTAGFLLVVLSVGGALAAVVGVPTAAGALVTITVNDAGDATPTPANCTAVTEGDCTLRAAIQAANAAGDDTTITLPDANTVPNNPSASHVYTVENANGEIDFNASGHTITLTGAGSGLAIVQMHSATTITNRVFGIDAGTTADISGISVEDGNVVGNGGGILDNATALNLSNSSLSGNTGQEGGGIDVLGGTATLTDDSIDANPGSAGGGVYITHGTTAVIGGTISSNTSSGAGGGIYIQNDSSPSDSTTLSGVTVDSNTAGGAGGGGYVQNDAEGSTNVTLTNDHFDSNTATGAGGGLYLQNDGGGSSTTITGGSVSSNTAGGAGGGIYDQNDGTNTTVSATTVAVNENTSTNGQGGGVYVENNGTSTSTTFAGGSIDENTANPSNDRAGGGVYLQNDGDPSTASFTGGSISGNSAYDGGGVFVQSGSTSSFSQETVAGNTASEAGGGFMFETAQSGSASITQSTISGNTVLGTVGISAVLGDGGGILSFECNAIALTNDTITANTAVNGGGYFGSACAESPTVSTAFRFDTISGNTATDGETGAGNVQTIDDSNLTFAQTIVANGSASGGPSPNCAFTGPGSHASLGYNLFGDASCGDPASDIVGQDPELGPLQNNGGPTDTELPADGSPAVGAIPTGPCSASGVGTDQRGVARGAGLNGSCTIGSVEVGQAALFNPNGYRLVADEGGIFDFGLNFNGSLANVKLNAPIIGLANSPGPNGYLLAGSDGGVFAQGGANFFGSLGGQAIPSAIAAIAAPPSETGYWLAAKNGKIYPFGSVPALPAVPLPPGAMIVGMASTTDGNGAWLTDQFGDVYAEGTAQYEGGLGGMHINAPVVGIAAAASGQGYVLAAADGGVFNYGTQGFFGSVPGALKPGQHLAAPIVGIAVTHSGNGYWEVGSDGGVFAFGDAPFLGSIYTTVPGGKLNGPIRGIQHLGSAPA